MPPMWGSFVLQLWQIDPAKEESDFVPPKYGTRFRTFIFVNLVALCGTVQASSDGAVIAL